MLYAQLVVVQDGRLRIVRHVVERAVRWYLGHALSLKIVGIGILMAAMKNAFALLIGIANYQYVSSLPDAVHKDVQEIYNALIDPALCGYLDGNVQLLLDNTATQAAIRNAFVTLRDESNRESTVFIYISSHGGQIESGSDAGEYILPVDTQLDDSISPVRLVASTAISGLEITQALRNITAHKLVVVFDCCHAGGIGQPKAVSRPVLKTGFPESYYDRIKTGRGRVIFASSRSNEVSYILPGDSNSLFTKHFLDGLRGKAVGVGGVIRIFDLFNFVQPKVVADQPNQHPLFKAEIEDNFPIALYLGGKAAVSTESTQSSDKFAYDVFISYRQQEPDRSWVRKQLVPVLRHQGLRVCVDYESFRLGAPMVKEMARAVEESRYTVAVLTPRYLESNFTDLESVLAEHLGLEKTQRRLLSIMREECNPRLGLRARMWLDMTTDEEFDLGLTRLVHELCLSPDV